MITLCRWIDRNLWSIPVLAFLIVELAGLVWSAYSTTPILLAVPHPTVRQQVYSSLTGSSSALLGLALAAVAVLAAFGPRPTNRSEETRLARARANLIGSLLTASFFLLVVLVTATLALPVDSKRFGNGVIVTLIEGASVASVLGLLISGLGFALVIVERSRQ